MDAILRTHHIDPAFPRSDDYPGFVESRRQRLIAEITTVMGKPVVDTGESVADDDDADEE
jgi:hypothetical protein